jgi:Txe/YoeB family toxin of Txe-Axe toxin-antitoxin module
MFRVEATNRAERDMDVCVRAGFERRLAAILTTLETAPYAPTHGFERLVGNLKGRCSRQIDKHNRIIYKVLPNSEGARDENGNVYEGIVHVLEAWGHNYKRTY